MDGAGARSLTLPAELPSVRAARAFVSETLSDDDAVDDEVLADVLLMTSELVANVVRHAVTDVVVTVRPGRPLRIEVHDGVAATAAFRELVQVGGTMPDVSSPGGRGLALVRTLATTVGLDDDPGGGKVVWFER